MKKLILIIVFVSVVTNLAAQDNSNLLAETISLKHDYQNSTFSGYNAMASGNVFQEDKLYNGHNYDYYHDKYIKATQTKKTGKILIIVGVPSCVVGLVFSGIGVSKSYGGEDGAGFYFFSGAFLAIGGFVAFNIGIPLMIIGGTKRKNNKKAIEKGWPNKKPDAKILTLGTTTNGFGLVLKL
jgi:hypothetical protein